MTHIPGHPPPTGLIGAEQALQGGLAGSLSGLQQGINLGRQDLAQFAQQGEGAINLQAALSGAAGTQAQQQAFQDFTLSPGQQFFRERQEQALLRNQAAIGGLGGGNVRSALQQQATGFAQQALTDQFAQLGQVSGQGLQAAGQRAQLAGAGGQQASNLAFQTGQSLAGGRTRAGEQIAQAIGGTTSALANLQAQGGAGISDLLGQTGGNLANLFSGAGAAQGQSQADLAALLANIATTSGSQIAGLPGIPGVSQSQGTLGGLGQLAGGIGGLIGAFSGG